MRCHCDGTCDSCQIGDLQRQLLELTREQTVILDTLTTAKRVTALTKSLSRLTGEPVLRSDSDEQERALRFRLAGIVGARERLLGELCRLCPTCEECQT